MPLVARKEYQQILVRMFHRLVKPDSEPQWILWIDPNVVLDEILEKRSESRFTPERFEIEAPEIGHDSVYTVISVAPRREPPI